MFEPFSRELKEAQFSKKIDESIFLIMIAVIGGVFVFGIYSFLSESIEREKKQKYSLQYIDEDTDKQIGGIVCEELSWGSDVIYPDDSAPLKLQEAPDPIDRPEFEIDRETMILEVVYLWIMFFDDEGARANDKRRKNFEEYAEYVVDAVIMYQDNPTDIGGQLPRHHNVHLLIAQMITMESSVNHDVVGKLGEIGLLQIMPNNKAALAGYKPRHVKNSPKLGVLLGVRWLAAMTEECPSTDVFDRKWDDYDWLGPLSAYAGGPNAKRKDGKCKSFDIARTRIDRTVMYRTRIDHMKEMEY